MAAAGLAAVGGAALVLQRLLAPPSLPAGRVEEALVYISSSTDQWWNSKAGTRVKVTDFGLWSGATAVWHGVRAESGEIVSGTGYPALVIRVPRVDAYHDLPSPPPWSLPAAYSLFYDDPTRDLRIVAVMDRCPHLCCYPGWHVITDLPIPRDYAVYGAHPPTYEVYGQDPIWCICHDAQFDPLLLKADVNPHSQRTFPGAAVVHGPATWALPLIPLRSVDDVLEGGMADVRWYSYC
ncbi:MAG TPA: hypothetical protein VIB49_00765 [Thermoplasmata archaeon]|jgi:Rieske Fe-S protein